ncbi:MAG: glycosyltransferase family 2 protein [Candidatus Omnitrophica bacterium]|nr:glycosyltransferase family 2 protein [Candidatus Omnitrophota bacterium]
MKKIDFSLILPCYNEEEHILKSVKTIIDTIKHLPYSSEIIFIDDKSKDKTRTLLKKIKTLYKLPIGIIFHNENMGRGATVAEGIKKAKGKVAGFIDIDCEISPIYIPLFISSIYEGFDVVSAHRVYEFNLFSFHRWLASKIYSYLIKKIFKFKLNDTEAGYKFFNREKIIPVLKKVKDNHWFWDTEVMIKATLAGLKIKEIPCVFIRRKDKTSTVKIIPDTFKYFKNIIRLRKELVNESL